MKRLTMWYDGNHAICENEECSLSDCPFADPICEQVQNIIDRLAAIEDILGDEYDLDRLSVLCNQRMSMREEVSQRFSLTANIPLDRLRELVEADREGRCVVLPRLEPWQGDPPGEPGPPGLCPNCNDWRGLVWDETTGGSRCTICGWTNAKT